MGHMHQFLALENTFICSLYKGFLREACCFGISFTVTRHMLIPPAATVKEKQITHSL